MVDLKPRCGPSSLCGVVFVALGLLGSGCARGEPPELLSVHRLEPGRAAAGDRLTITGEGFPDGRAATVTFRGDLRRPGTDPERDVRVVARATPAGRNVLSFTLDGSLERRFAGSGSGALHTTFQGDVRVSFEADRRGVMAVSGTAHDIRFDILPTSPGERAAEASEEPALPALGMSATVEPSGAGLRVTAVAPDGRAAAASLRAGDVLLELDGVTLLSAADLVPRGGEQTAELTVMRDGRALPSLPLDVEGLAPLGPAALRAPAGVLLAACAALVLLATRLSRALLWLEVSKEPRAAVGSREKPRGGLGRAAGALVLPIAGGRELTFAALLTFVAIVLGFVRLSTGHALVSQDLDLPSLSLAAFGALLLSRFADGGSRKEGGFSLGAALAALGQTLGTITPGLLAIVGAVLASGRFVIAEMVSEQGASPLRWAAARNPGLAVLSLALVSSLIPETGDRDALPAEGLPARRLERLTVVRTLVRLAEWSYLWVMTALAVALFFGGYRLPAVPSLVQEASRSLALLGALLFVAKVGLLGLLVGAARSALSRPSVAHVWEIAATRILPASVAAVLLSAAWAAALEGARSAAISDLCALTTVGLSVLLAGHFVVSRARTGKPSATTTVNPWL